MFIATGCKWYRIMKGSYQRTFGIPPRHRPDQWWVWWSHFAYKQRTVPRGTHSSSITDTLLWICVADAKAEPFQEPTRFNMNRTGSLNDKMRSQQTFGPFADFARTDPYRLCDTADATLLITLFK
ncbi:MAG: hypothetical protein B6D77_05110 [gamma proteobacterium symbiont of Ctena orbiculata]|nr:MAG: hypothetical protein B6D77_05110 [gamma proteobacterium symbiont of Ctena orbiculata]